VRWVLKSLRRLWTGTPPRTPLRREEDLRVVKWMQLISSTSLIIALIIWMVWIEPL
jgi:hypothetical protein